MKVAITGSTGLVGSELAPHLRGLGHEVVPITRGDPDDPGALWSPGRGWIREGAFAGVDAVINLNGANLADKRWTESRKQVLRTSRIDLTRFLVDHLASLPSPPRVLVQSSGTDFYGPRGDVELDEDNERGHSFLAGLCSDWEAEAFRAREFGARVAVMRCGVVLSKKGGALAKMLLPFRLGVGGRIGSGRQYLSWISLPDAVAGYSQALQHNELDGPVNLAAPNPVTNAEFTKALGRALHRPTIFPVPPLALKVLYGSELVEETLLGGQRVSSDRLQSTGFEFRYPTVEEALRATLRSRA